MEFTNQFINRTSLHYGCKSGNVELVKYIISLDKFDTNLKDILFYF